MKKRINQYTGFTMMFMLMVAVLFITGFYSVMEKNPETDKTQGDKISSHRFTAGDSIFSFPISPNTDIYIEAYDSAGAGGDTIKVYITASFNDGAINTTTNTLAWLTRLNDTNSVGIFFTPVQSQGVIIPGASTTVFYKVNYPYPGTLRMVRSNVDNLTDVSYITVKAMSKPQGAVRSLLPYGLMEKPDILSMAKLKNWHNLRL